MFCMMITIKVKEGSEEAAHKTLGELVRETATHDGLILFRWFRHLKDPRSFILIEQWKDRAAVDAHIPKIIDLWNAFIPNLDGEPVATEIAPVVE